MQVTTLASYPKSTYPKYSDALAAMHTWYDQNSSTYSGHRMLIGLSTLLFYYMRPYTFFHAAYTTTEGMYFYIIKLDTEDIVELYYINNSWNYRNLNSSNSAGLAIRYK